MVDMRRRLARTFTGSGAGRFLLAALAVGVLVGLGASVIVWLIALFHAGADDVDGWLSLGRYLALLSVPIGIFISWSLARIKTADAVESGGVTETLVAFNLRSGYISTPTIPAKILATGATLGLGGSAGREGPMVLIGGAIGSSIARHTRFGEDQIRSLIAAGAGAGIGAAFNAPIAGMLFAMEVLLGNFAVRHLNAVVVASVAAAVTTRSLVGEERLLSAPPHRLGSPSELVLYAALGLLAVAFAVLFIKVLERVSGVATTWSWPGWTRPTVAGLIVGGLAVLEPELFGTGQDFVARVLRGESGRVWWVLVILAFAKMLAASLTRSGGGSGGTFMPSLFIGAVVGSALAGVVGPAWGFSTLDTGAFAVVGMSATFAAAARAPLTAILIVFEITGDYGLVLPLMLATSLATLLAERLHPGSIYTQPLRVRGINLLSNEDIDLLDTVTVKEVMSLTLNPLPLSMTTREADQVLDRERHHGLPVVDHEDRLVGIITVSDIADSGGPSDGRTVEDVMTPNPITVTPTMAVSVALARMAALGIGRMPVVADSDPTHLVGMFRRESVVHAYHHALGATTDRHLYRERLKQRTQPGAGFFEMPVPTGSAVAGKTIRQIRWPREATLVSIRRGASVLIPHGDTVLRADDTITAFGTGEARVELGFLVEAEHTAELEAIVPRVEPNPADHRDGPPAS